MFSLSKIANDVWSNITCDDIPEIISDNGKQVLIFTPSFGNITKVKIYIDYLSVEEEDESGEFTFVMDESLFVDIYAKQSEDEVMYDEIFIDLKNYVLKLPYILDVIN